MGLPNYDRASHGGGDGGAGGGDAGGDGAGGDGDPKITKNIQIHNIQQIQKIHKI